MLEASYHNIIIVSKSVRLEFLANDDYVTLS